MTFELTTFFVISSNAKLTETWAVALPRFHTCTFVYSTAIKCPGMWTAHSVEWISLLMCGLIETVLFLCLWKY